MNHPPTTAGPARQAGRSTCLTELVFTLCMASLVLMLMALAAHPAASVDSPSTGCAVSTRFPEKVLQWCELITRHAESTGLPPDLVAALIWQESGGSASAYSHSGAVGLMQVMPRDGLASAFLCRQGPCFKDRPSIDELQDPEFNVQYGTAMLRDLLVKYHGDAREALRAYGPMDRGYAYADTVLALYQKYGN